MSLIAKTVIIAAMDIGATIRAAREARGLSQRGLGKILGVSGSAVAQWETGVSRMTVDNRVNLSNALDIPILELLPEDAGKGELTIRDKEEIFLIQRFRALSGPLREAFLRFVVVQADALMRRDDPPSD